MREHAVLYLNGRRHDVRGPALLRPLSTWLREDRWLTGTKIVCAEGDCGACSLLVGQREGDADDRLTYRAIDSCIAFVYQMDRAHVVTVEGLREADGSLSAVQRAMVDCHGSQCGFCTPGFVTTIHAVHEERRQVGLTVNGEGAASESRFWREALSGNLCRCTGYLQIFDAARAVDAEALTGLNDRYPPAEMLAAFEEADAETLDAAFDDAGRACRVAAPRTLEAAAAFRAEHPGCRIASGTTDLGVQHRHGRFTPESVLGLHAVDGLEGIDRVTDDGGSDHLVLGAAATWTAVARAVERDLPGYHRLLMRFGSPQIRNAGTLAGNVANGSPIADSIPLLMALDAELELISAPDGPASATRRRVPLTGFYTGYKEMDLRSDELIAAVRLPLPTPTQRVFLEKVSRRRDMDISTLTCAVVLTVEDNAIRDARIAFGGVAATVRRFPAAEAFLEDAPLSEASLREAGRLVREEVTPLTDVRGSAGYRLSLIENVLAKAYFEFQSSPATESPRRQPSGGAR